MRKLLSSLALLALVGSLAAGFVGCGNLDQETAKPAAGPGKFAQVEVFNEAFQPGSVTIQTGGKVSWKNRDKVKYSVMVPGLFNQVLDEGTVWEYTFNQAGTYNVCDEMQAPQPCMTVVVK